VIKKALHNHNMRFDGESLLHTALWLQCAAALKTHIAEIWNLRGHGAADNKGAALQ
jgi:hypothetical protein